MQLQQPFNAQSIDPTQGGNFQQLPLGDHPVMIVASEVKATQNNDGGMVVFELKVIGGPKEGSGGQWILNLYNKSDKARDIAEKQMSALCHATGQFLVNDTAQLHGLPFAVRVTEQPLTPQQLEKKNNGENVTPFTQVTRVLMPDGSEVKGFAQGGGQQQGGQGGNWGNNQQQPQTQQQPQQGNNGGGGWGNNQQAQSPAPAPAPTPSQGGGWGGGQQTQAPAQQPQNNGGGWTQGNGGGNPAWGAKK